MNVNKDKITTKGYERGGLLYRNNELTEQEIAYSNYLDECLASCTSRKTIWKLYAMTPSNGRFTLQVLDESSKEILDSASFRKDDATERETGEASLRALIAKIHRVHGQGYPYPRMTAEFTYGFQIAYMVRVYIEETTSKS